MSEIANCASTDEFVWVKYWSRAARAFLGHLQDIEAVLGIVIFLAVLVAYIVLRRRHIERLHQSRERDWREQDSLRGAALKDRNRDGVVDARDRDRDGDAVPADRDRDDRPL